MNEWYLRDCSRKQCAAYQARGNAGKPTTNCAIYGYRKDPEDKHHWLIDEEAAAVVRRIFLLSMEGHGPHEIASILRDDRIERPSVYMGKRGQGTQRNSYDDSRPYDWSGTSVSNILAKPEYMGHTVNFRSYKESYKDKRAIKRPPEEWTVFLVWTKKMQILITLQHNVFCRICLSKLSLQVSSTNAQIAHSGDRKLGISPDETGL